ncbi:hypothetical protein DFH09DRAFT_1089956 [Mycena vulgaris]|nr:hypothetical protein DFH09DRAFT_1089956 [Mycena vulgaris]
MHARDPRPTPPTPSPTDSTTRTQHAIPPPSYPTHHAILATERCHTHRYVGRARAAFPAVHAPLRTKYTETQRAGGDGGGSARDPSPLAWDLFLGVYALYGLNRRILLILFVAGAVIVSLGAVTVNTISAPPPHSVGLAPLVRTKAAECHVPQLRGQDGVRLNSRVRSPLFPGNGEINMAFTRNYLLWPSSLRRPSEDVQSDKVARNFRIIDLVNIASISMFYLCLTSGMCSTWYETLRLSLIILVIVPSIDNPPEREPMGILTHPNMHYEDTPDLGSEFSGEPVSARPRWGGSREQTEVELAQTTCPGMAAVGNGFEYIRRIEAAPSHSAG